MTVYVVDWHSRDEKYDFWIYLGGRPICGSDSENGRQADAETYLKSRYPLEPGDTIVHKGSKPPD